MLNAWWTPLRLTMAVSVRDLAWKVALDTTAQEAAGRAVGSNLPVTRSGRSLLVLRSARPGASGLNVPG